MYFVLLHRPATKKYKGLYIELVLGQDNFLEAKKSKRVARSGAHMVGPFSCLVALYVDFFFS
jgi:hypothetical protein